MNFGIFLEDFGIFLTCNKKGNCLEIWLTYFQDIQTIIVTKYGLFQPNYFRMNIFRLVHCVWLRPRCHCQEQKRKSNKCLLVCSRKYLSFALEQAAIGPKLTNHASKCPSCEISSLFRVEKLTFNPKGCREVASYGYKNS